MKRLKLLAILSVVLALMLTTVMAFAVAPQAVKMDSTQAYTATRTFDVDIFGSTWQQDSSVNAKMAKIHAPAEFGSMSVYMMLADIQIKLTSEIFFQVDTVRFKDISAHTQSMGFAPMIQVGSAVLPQTTCTLDETALRDDGILMTTNVTHAPVVVEIEVAVTAKEIVVEKMVRFAIAA